LTQRRTMLMTGKFPACLVGISKRGFPQIFSRTEEGTK